MGQIASSCVRLVATPQNQTSSSSPVTSPDHFDMFFKKSINQITKCRTHHRGCSSFSLSPIRHNVSYDMPDDDICCESTQCTIIPNTTSQINTLNPLEPEKLSPRTVLAFLLIVNQTNVSIDEKHNNNKYQLVY